MAKAAGIDPARSLEFIKELSMQGWERTNALRGYVAEVGKGGNWRQVVSDLEFFENHRGKDGEPRAFRPGTKGMIAGQWMNEDVEEGVRWFTEEIPRDYSNDDDVNNVAVALARLPEEKRFQVLDWVERQRGEAGWSDQVSMTLGKHWIQHEPDHHTERLVNLLPGEEDRFLFVTNYVGNVVPSKKLGLRYAPEVLDRLVDAANLSEGHSTQLKEVIASAHWVQK